MIDKEIIFKILLEGEEKAKTKVIERKIVKKAKKYLDYKEIMVITGVRRSGKTYLMYLLMQHLKEQGKKAVYINFEDERLAFIQALDLDKLLEYIEEYLSSKKKKYLFLDEIQNIPLWQKWVSRNFEKYKFIISGSNSQLLSSEFATAISGRYIELRIYPFTFNELVKPPNKKTLLLRETALIKQKFDEYFEFGGFPEVILNKKKDILQDYFKSILLRDVIARHDIKHKQLLEKMALLLSTNIGNQISLYSLEKLYSIGINTIKNYLNYLEESYMFIFIPKFSYSLKKQQYNPKKVYSIDIALSESVSFRFSEDKGRKLENLILINIISNNKEVYYHKGTNECDFLILEKGKIIEAIQVTWSLNEQNKKRELNGLKEAMQKYGVKGTIITYDQKETIEGIKIMPAWEWLLKNTF